MRARVAFLESGCPHGPSRRPSGWGVATSRRASEPVGDGRSRAPDSPARPAQPLRHPGSPEGAVNIGQMGNGNKGHRGPSGAASAGGDEHPCSPQESRPGFSCASYPLNLNLVPASQCLPLRTVLVRSIMGPLPRHHPLPLRPDWQRKEPSGASRPRRRQLIRERRSQIVAAS